MSLCGCCMFVLSSLSLSFCAWYVYVNFLPDNMFIFCFVCQLCLSLKNAQKEDTFAIIQLLQSWASWVSILMYILMLDKIFVIYMCQMALTILKILCLFVPFLYSVWCKMLFQELKTFEKNVWCKTLFQELKTFEKKILPEGGLNSKPYGTSNHWAATHPTPLIVNTEGVEITQALITF